MRRKFVYVVLFVFLVGFSLLPKKSIVQEEPMVWAGWVTQFATNNPSVTEIHDDFNTTISFQRAASGQYAILDSNGTFSEFHTTVSVAFEQPIGMDAKSYAFDYLAPNVMGFEIWNDTSNTDNWNAFIEIQVYP